MKTGMRAVRMPLAAAAPLLAAGALVAPGALPGPARPAVANITASTTSAVTTVRHLPGTTCTAFPPDNYWHADVSRLPVHPRSAAWISHMSPRNRLHPDFGPSYGAQPVPYGIPVTVVGGGHAKVHVSFLYRSES